jgi:3-hydroxybutyryl-CoA dehydrogenase
MNYQITLAGSSRAFETQHLFLTNASADKSDGMVLIGTGAGAAFQAMTNRDKLPFVAIELGTECLGVHTGEDAGNEGSNVVGFARFRLGEAEPSNLIELVKQPRTRPESIAAAREAFESAGFVVAVCGDFPGRIVDRLIRPYYNAALRRLDEGLASASDMDTTLKLGLGYPEGPIALLTRTGLAHHHDVTQALYEALGSEAYAPARRAQVAKQRERAAE